MLKSVSVKYNRRESVEWINRDNVGLILSLKFGENGQILVANTHLLYNPGREDIRLAQCALLVTGNK